MDIILIRHGKTQGNLEKQYIGSTNQLLCQIGIDEILKQVKKNCYSDIGIIASSPLSRCLQTAHLIYPDKKIIINKNLEEANFGEFEGKSYEQLKNNDNYTKWIETKGESNLHSGEPMVEFKKRAIKGFKESVSLAENAGVSSVGIITHGGVIMNIMAYLMHSDNPFDWQVQNGAGYLLRLEKNIFRKIGEL